MSAEERKRKSVEKAVEAVLSKEREEAEVHDLRMHEFRIREEEERARALVARVGLRAALLGGLLATIGGAAAAMLLRWIDPRPAVIVRCECACGPSEESRSTINQNTGEAPQ